MSNPGALVSANASLSAMLGGAVGATVGGAASGTGSVAGPVAANGAQTTDFTTLLSGQTALTTDSTPRATFSASSADATPSIDLTDAPNAAATDATSDAAAPACGKSLPFAAIMNAVLPPMPITLAALVPGGGAQGDASATDDATGDATADTQAATQSTTPGLDAQALALMAMAQGTATPASPTTPASPPTPATSTTPATTGTADTQNFPQISLNTASPALTSKEAKAIRLAIATPQVQGATADTSLPRPGFTLIPDAATAADTPSAPTPQLAAARGDVTITADAAIAMSGPIHLASADPQPGFTLMSDAATTATPVAAQLAQADSDATATTQVPAGKATARVQGKLAAATPRGAIKAGAGADAPAAQSAVQTGAQDSASSPFPHSPESSPADGVSMPDNAPSPIQQLASAGTVNVAQTLAATGGAATLSNASLSTGNQTGGTDMAALVDRLVEARAAARSGLGGQSVQATVTHADFGRVSLRFNQDDEGLSISMSSRDPGFAPAAQAALAQAPSVAASAQSQSAGQQSGNQQGSGQHWTQAGLHTAMQSGTQSGMTPGNGGQTGAGPGGQNWNQGGQNGAPYAQPSTIQQTHTTLAGATTTQTSARSRGGILA